MSGVQGSEAPRTDEQTDPGSWFHPRWTSDEIDPATEMAVTKVLDAAFRVHRKLGAGFKESVYQKCMVHALQRDGVAVRERVMLGVEFEGLLIEDAGHPDLVVEDRVIVELKATDGFSSAQTAQVINYLKASGHAVGLLINFNVAYLRQGIRRSVHPDIVAQSRKRRESQSP